jgi:hypothetical protein
MALIAKHETSSREESPDTNSRQALATEAADILSIATAMTKKTTSERLFSRLETFDAFAQKGPGDPKQIFVALSLPTANDLIHLTTTQEKLANAREWVRERWSGRLSDESTTLASLTLIYIVYEGWRRHSGDDAKRDIWERIKSRVDASN